MYFKIKSAKFLKDEALLKEYPILELYCYDYATQDIKIICLEELMNLIKKLGKDVVISSDTKEILIYDAFIE
jgi:hypothetical protein